MQLNDSIFKAYDIRGVVPKEFDAQAAYRIAQAVVKVTGAKRVVLGYDARGSSPKIVERVREALLDQGVLVIDIGLVTTPMFNFAVASDSSIQAGIMVTASHNPPEYNGMKLVSGLARPIGAGSGMEKVRQYAHLAPFPPVEKRGKVVSEDVSKDYLNEIFQIAKWKKLNAKQKKRLAELRLVIDAGNGMVGVLLKKFLKQAGIKAEVLFEKVDCRFPNHEANPVKASTLKALMKQILKSKAAFGVAFDGDADRLGVVDDKGERVPGDLVGALIATELLAAATPAVRRSALILGDTNAGWAFKEQIESLGAKFKIVPVGHANIKAKMRETEALFAAELSYHFYYRDFYNVESTLLSLLLLVRSMLSGEAPLSERLKPLKKYFASGEVNCEIEAPVKVLKKILETFMPENPTVLTDDGIRLEFEDWWFSLRPSNTEPVVRLNVEATSKKLMEKKRDQITAMLRRREMY